MNKHVEQWRSNHHKSLETLAANGADGLTLWRKLRRAEQAMHQCAEWFCDGTMSEAAFEESKENTRNQVAKIFGKLPEGFFVNGDPRGYSLKLQPENTPEGMHRDWGNYGCLAAVID